MMHHQNEKKKVKKKNNNEMNWTKSMWIKQKVQSNYTFEEFKTFHFKQSMRFVSYYYP